MPRRRIGLRTLRWFKRELDNFREEAATFANFPTLFMGRVVSPNDVFANFDPWSIVKPLDVQNSVINDPPTSYFTLMSLLSATANQS